MSHKFYLFIILFSLIPKPGDQLIERHSFDDNYEHLLLNELLINYSSKARPVKQFSHDVQIHFDMNIRQIGKLDIKQQTLDISVFVLMQWEDVHLQWDPSEFNGTDSVTIEPHRIWTPDIMLHNSAVEKSLNHLEVYKNYVICYHNGTLIWMAPIAVVSSCSVDITWFPFDTQVCSLSFGSWTYAKKKLALLKWDDYHGKNKSKAAHRHYVKSGEWRVLSIESALEDVHYPCCNEPYSSLTYTIKLKRYPRYFLLYLVLPCIAITALFLLSFFIPPDGGERMGFGVTILLSLSVYLLVISDKLPEKSDSSPMIGIIYSTIFFSMCCGLVLSNVVIIVSNKKHRMSDRLKSVVNFWNRKRKNSQAVDAEPTEMKYSKYLNACNWRKLASIIDTMSFVFFLVIFITVPIVVSVLYASENS